MDLEAVLQQTRFENEMLGHIKGALRVVLDWQVGEKEMSRKLSSLRFISQSLQRHLERTMALEENDGYMVLLAELNPQLQDRIADLKGQHEALRARFRKIMPHLDRVAPGDEDSLASLCDDLASFVQAIDDHDAQERSFLADVFGK